MVRMKTANPIEGLVRAGAHRPMIRARRVHTTVLMLLIVALGSAMARGDLVALWDFEHGGDDACGGHHGTTEGKAAFVAGPGGSGRALKLDGASYVTVPHAPELSIRARITVAAWIKVRAFSSGWQAIVTKGDSAWRLQRARDGDSMQFACTGVVAGADNLIGISNVNDGTWHHVVGGYSGSEMFLYVDGLAEARSSVRGEIAVNTEDVRIGSNTERLGREWNGLIDDVMVFDHALSEREIAYLYRLGVASFTSPELQAAVQKAEKACAMSNRGAFAEALPFLEAAIGECQEHRRLSTDEMASRYNVVLSELYFLLGQAQQAAGRPEAHVVRSFSESVLCSLDGPQCVRTLAWLSDVLPKGEYSTLIGRARTASGRRDLEAIRHVARSFESVGNWSGLEAFLDALLPHVDNPTACAASVTRGLTGNRLWLQRFQRYCWDDPALGAYAISACDASARWAIEESKFPKAIRLYEDVLGRCDSQESRAAYEIKICRCLFEDGQYTQVVEKTGRFIADYAKVNKSLYAQTLLLRGKSQAHLGQVAEASKTLSLILAEYPDVAEAREAAFLIGYLQMRAGDNDKAAETFEALLAGDGDGLWASKAHVCLGRVRRSESGK